MKKIADWTAILSAIVSTCSFIIAFAALMLTIIYSKKAEKNSIRPFLVVNFVSINELTIKNIGNGPAIDLAIEVRTPNNETRNEDLNFALSKDEDRTINILSYFEIDEPELINEVRIRCSDVEGNEYPPFVGIR